MDISFLAQNSHWEEPGLFAERDPELRKLKSLRYVYQFTILNQFPTNTPGIFTLTGTHQSGKTTLLKTWIKNLLDKDIFPKRIIYFACETLENYHALQREVQKQIESLPANEPLHIILDDISAVRDWEKGIKPLADSGSLNHVVLMLSSSDLTLAQKVQNLFFNQRDKIKAFQINTLSFHETVVLKYGDKATSQTLSQEFNHYLVHGGYLCAINDIATNDSLSDSMIKMFVNWICKETEKRGKQERYLREILTAIIKHYTEQITWNALAQELTIDHPKTIGDYLEMLEDLGIVFVQYALLEDSLKAAPKKARKLMFTDPFIFHAIQACLSSSKNQYAKQIRETLNDPIICSKVVEGCAITQFRRFHPTYYIKGEGTVDLAYVENQRFWPIEITWSNPLRAKDLKQILKYSNGRILTKTERSGIIQQIKTEPLFLALWQLGEVK